MASAAEVVRVAVAEKGYVESGSNLTKYAPAVGHANGLAWCATYVAWVMKQVGQALPSTSASTVVMATGFCKAGQWRSRNDKAQPGDVVFFNFPGHSGRPSPGCGAPKGICHVGIVVEDRGGSVLCAEGNTAGPGGDQRNGGQVHVKLRAKKLIAGYGVPKYSGAAAPKQAAPAAPKKEPEMAGLTEPDKKFLKDMFILVIRGEANGKKTGHPNLEDLTKAVSDLKGKVAALEADAAKHGVGNL